MNSQDAWIWQTFWSLDVETSQQMQELSQLFHQMVMFDPLIYHIQKQNFFFYSAYDSRYPIEKI